MKLVQLQQICLDAYEGYGADVALIELSVIGLQELQQEILTRTFAGPAAAYATVNTATGGMIALHAEPALKGDNWTAFWRDHPKPGAFSMAVGGELEPDIDAVLTAYSRL